MLAGLVAGCASAPGKTSAPPVLPQASAPPPAASPTAGDAAATDAVRAGLGRLPVSFVANQGRWDPRAAWVASGNEATAYFLDGGVRWALLPAQGAARALLPAQGAAGALAGDEQGFVLDQVLVGAREAAPTASVTAPGIVSYFVGETHHAGLPTATELTLEQAWPGVDVVWSGTGGHIEATYHLAPGADPAQVRVAWRGAESVAVTAEGRLGVTTPVRSFEEDAPKAFQDVDGQRVPVEVAYDLDGAGTYGFRLGAYDPARPLVIDPTVLVYAGFLGGSGTDVGIGIAVDGAGNAYVTGSDPTPQPPPSRRPPGCSRPPTANDSRRLRGQGEPHRLGPGLRQLPGRQRHRSRPRHRRGRGRQRLCDRRHHQGLHSFPVTPGGFVNAISGPSGRTTTSSWPR